MGLHLKESKPNPEELNPEQVQLEFEAAQEAEKQTAEKLRNFSMMASLTAIGEPAELDRLRRAVDEAADRRRVAEADCQRLGLDPNPLATEIDQTGPSSLAA